MFLKIHGSAQGFASKDLTVFRLLPLQTGLVCLCIPSLPCGWTAGWDPGKWNVDKSAVGSFHFQAWPLCANHTSLRLPLALLFVGIWELPSRWHCYKPAEGHPATCTARDHERTVTGVRVTLLHSGSYRSCSRNEGIEVMSSEGRQPKSENKTLKKARQSCSKIRSLALEMARRETTPFKHSPKGFNER